MDSPKISFNPTELVEELVESADIIETKTTPPPPKKNTKSSKIDKIIEISDKYGFTYESRSSLMRQSKSNLDKLLTNTIQNAMKIESKKENDNLGDTTDEMTRQENLVFLRLLNSMLAKLIEKGGNVVLRSVSPNYEIVDFGMKIDSQKELIDNSLSQILDRYPNMLSNVNSPFTKLALVYSGVLVQSIQKKIPLENKHKLNVARI